MNFGPLIAQLRQNHAAEQTTGDRNPQAAGRDRDADDGIVRYPSERHR